MGRAGGLREDSHQRPGAAKGVGRAEASERTPIKGLGPPREWGGQRPQRGLPSKAWGRQGSGEGRGLREDSHQRPGAAKGVGRAEASERTSIKGLGPPAGEWGGQRPQSNDLPQYGWGWRPHIIYIHIYIYLYIYIYIFIYIYIYIFIHIPSKD